MKNESSEPYLVITGSLRKFCGILWVWSVYELAMRMGTATLLDVTGKNFFFNFFIGSKHCLSLCP